MQTERVELYFRQGSSDKVYHLELDSAEDRWSAQAQWGRRGSALQSDVKVNGTSYEEAKRVYDRPKIQTRRYFLRALVGLRCAARFNTLFLG